VAGALAGVITPLAAHASLTISVQLAPGAAGATQTVKYLTPVNTGTDIPVYVYATVTGATSVTAGTSFQGFQYAYYNALAANGISGTGISPTLDTAATALTNESAAYNFAANGSNIGSAANIGSGILAGSTTALSDIAHARTSTNAPVWNTTSAANNSYVSSNGQSVSFLIETLNVKPGAFTASSIAANGQNYSKVSVSIPNITSPSLGGPEYQGANWNEDSTSSTGTGSTSSIKNGSYTASPGFVSLEDTLPGDANGDGSVSLADFVIFNSNFGHTGTFNWSQGDFNGDTAVSLADFVILSSHFGQSLTGIAPTVPMSELAPLAQFAAAHGITAEFDAAIASDPAIAVPEPVGLSLLGFAGLGLLTRRRRVSTK